MKRGNRARPESAGREKCAFCRKIGCGLSVFVSRGQAVPEEIERFDILLSSPLHYSLLRCPDCGTCFKRHDVVDNEIIYGYESVEIEEVSAARVREIRRFEANENRKFSRRLNACLKGLGPTFSPQEEAVIRTFRVLRQDHLSMHDVAQLHPREDRSGIQATLESMIRRGALVKVNLSGIAHYRLR